MDMLILHIDKPPAGESQYPVSLVKLSSNEDLGQTSFPADLAPPGFADPLTADKIRDVFATTTSDNAVLPRIGAQLYALVGQGSVHDHLDPNGEPRRVLLDIRPVELRNLPWELMARNGIPLMAGQARPICRGNLQGVPLQDPDWPLRVLVVVGSKADDEGVQNDKKVLAEEEVGAIIEAIRDREADIDLLIMYRPLRHKILEAFEDPQDLERAEPHQGFKPHVLHFIGHGGIRPHSGESYLQLWDEAQNIPEPWFADDIRADFLVRDKPRLVIVNACRTAQLAANGLWSVTDAFQDVGIPAVIGMRTVVSGEHARLFSSSLYQALVRGQALDAATVAARRRVFQAVTNATKRLEWASPTLQVSNDPDTIIRVGQRVQETERQRVQQLETLQKVRGLADRRTHRWSAWRNVSEEKPAVLRKVLIVLGEEDVGKTEFARMIMERCALCGHQLRYVDMAGESRGDALAVLRRICDGDGRLGDEFLLTSPLPQAAFSEFKATVEQVLDAPLSADSRLTAIEPVSLKGIFEAFQRGLEQSVATPPLVIVLDHLATIDEEQFRSFLIPHLITWCANRQDPNIRLILLLTQSEYNKFQLSTVRTRFRTIQIGDFEPERWPELAQEYIKRNLKPPQREPGGPDPVQILNDFIVAWGNFEHGRWKPERLEVLRGRAQQAGWQWLLA